MGYVKRDSSNQKIVGWVMFPAEGFDEEIADDNPELIEFLNPPEKMTLPEN